MRIRTIVIAVVAVMACLHTAKAAPFSSQQVEELQNSFKFNGKPIHPALIQQFESWLSDPGVPITVSVDVAAASGTNQYSDEGVVEQPQHVVQFKSGYKTYSYEWVGHLNNGLHVVRTWSSGSGSGVFQTLFFLREDQSTGYLADGTPYPRLLLTAVRAYPLGDRSNVTILLKGDSVDLTIKAFPSGKKSNVVLQATKE